MKLQGPRRHARPVMAVSVAIAMWTATGAAAPATAQEPTAQPAPATPAVAQEDVFDLLRRIRGKTPPPDPSPSGPAAADAWDYRKRMLTIMPTLGAKPSTGFTFGAAGNLAVYFGDPATTPISSAVVSASVSTKEQIVVGAKFGASAPNDQLRLEGDNRFQWTSQDTFGLGTGTEPTDDVNARFTYMRVYETVLFALGKGLLGGVGVHYSTHSDLRPGEDAAAAWDQSPFVEYSLQHGFDLESQTSAGFGLNLVFDSRDHPINASRGWLASVSFRPYFKDVLGSDSVWQEVVLDVRTFTKVTSDGRKKLAFWVYGDFVADGVAPYFALPAIGTDTYGRTGRGYVEGRFRGERLLYGEIEYRATLTKNGLLGMVAFANTATVANLQSGERLFDSYAPAGGVGLRLLFNKRSKTNLCVDYALGTNGSKGLYLALQEAF